MYKKLTEIKVFFTNNLFAPKVLDPLFVSFFPNGPYVSLTMMCEGNDFFFILRTADQPTPCIKNTEITPQNGIEGEWCLPKVPID